MSYRMDVEYEDMLETIIRDMGLITVNAIMTKRNEQRDDFVRNFYHLIKSNQKFIDEYMEEMLLLGDRRFILPVFNPPETTNIDKFLTRLEGYDNKIWTIFYNNYHADLLEDIDSEEDDIINNYRMYVGMVRIISIPTIYGYRYDLKGIDKDYGQSLTKNIEYKAHNPLLDLQTYSKIFGNKLIGIIIQLQ